MDGKIWRVRESKNQKKIMTIKKVLNLGNLKVIFSKFWKTSKNSQIFLKFFVDKVKF